MDRLNALNIKDRGLITGIFHYDDHYIDKGLRLYNLEQALHLYLKEQGYQIIVFFNTTNGFYSYNQDMLGQFLSEAGSPSKNKEIDNHAIELNASPVGHSFGKPRYTRIRKDNSQVPENMMVNDQRDNITQDDYGRFKTKSKGNRDANLREFDYNLREKQHCAIIVTATENVPEFDQTQSQSLSERLNDIKNHKSNDNKLIVLFDCTSNRNELTKIFKQLNNSAFTSTYFRNVFTRTIKDGDNDSETLNEKNTFAISSPQTSDILRAMEYARIEYNGLQKEIDWLNIEDICDQLSMKGFKEGNYITLDETIAIMKKKKRYDYNAFESDGVEKRGKALDELTELIGLEAVKKQIQSYRELLEMKREQGKEVSTFNKHMVFYGNPGTGKTTVARIVARILKDLGLIKKGHLVEVSREHLVAGYVGQTAIKTRQVIESALDGVLFIDEAYRLADGGSNDFGHEAVNTLLACMENYRDRLVVILAGYENEMKRLYDMNEGLKSRIPNEIYFEDYNAEELKQIFLLSARKSYTIPEEVDKLLSQMMEYVVEYKEERYDQDEARTAKTDPIQGTKGLYKFGNGRWVRNLFEKVESKVAARQKDSDISCLQPSDFDGLDMEELKDFIPGKQKKEKVSPIDQLHRLVGLSKVKREIDDLIKQVKFDIKAQQEGQPVDDIPMGHMVFYGNPGTGKTTVANLMAGILHELGILPNRYVRDVSRQELVSNIVGQTAKNVAHVCEHAKGGVLFIDEVYSLVKDDNDSFGKEAIDTLIQCMEKYRNEMVVIIAGYEELMQPFLDRNPGLKSRFNTFVHFEDYNADELKTILMGIIAAKGYQLSQEAKEHISVFVNEAHKTMERNDGNGRWARNVADKIIQAHKSNCIERDFFNNVISFEDIESGISKFKDNQL